MAASLVALVLAAGGVAWGSIPESTGTLRGCDPTGGTGEERV